MHFRFFSTNGYIEGWGLKKNIVYFDRASDIIIAVEKKQSNRINKIVLKHMQATVNY